MTAVAAPPVLADLLLARLLTQGKSPAGSKRLREDLGQLLGGPPSAEEFDQLVEDLHAAGLVTKRPVRLTPEGRERALSYLGATQLPARANWGTIRAKFLVPKALGLSAAAAAKLDGDKFAAFLVKRHYKLPVGAGTTLKQVLEALACRELGFPDETNLKAVMRVKLSELVEADGNLTAEQLEKQLPRVATGAKTGKLDELRSAVLRAWLGAAEAVEEEQETPPVPPRVDFDLATFAATVRALARSAPPADRFWDNKVFIAPLWRASQREHGFPRLTLPEFKERLVEANRAGLLSLSRADLVQAMDPALVAESETGYLNATFHFVLIEGDRP